jgi:hypothetical protein
LLSNCVWRGTSPEQVCRRRGRWSQQFSHERQNLPELSQRRGLAPRKKRQGKRLRRRN